MSASALYSGRRPRLPEAGAGASSWAKSSRVLSVAVAPSCGFAQRTKLAGATVRQPGVMPRATSSPTPFHRRVNLNEQSPVLSYGQNATRGVAEYVEMTHVARLPDLFEGVGPGTKVLDNGCGAGLMGLELASTRGAHVHGISPQPFLPELLAMVQRLPEACRDLSQYKPLFAIGYLLESLGAHDSVRAWEGLPGVADPQARSASATKIAADLKARYDARVRDGSFVLDASFSEEVLPRLANRFDVAVDVWGGASYSPHPGAVIEGVCNAVVSGGAAGIHYGAKLDHQVVLPSGDVFPMIAYLTKVRPGELKVGRNPSVDRKPGQDDLWDYAIRFQREPGTDAVALNLEEEETVLPRAAGEVPKVTFQIRDKSLLPVALRDLEDRRALQDGS
jgi:hypothetical protein